MTLEEKLDAADNVTPAEERRFVALLIGAWGLMLAGVGLGVMAGMLIHRLIVGA